MRVPINVDLGCDFHLTYDNIENATRNPSTYTINGGRYLLLELPEFGIYQLNSQVLFRFSATGISGDYPPGTQFRTHGKTKPNY